MNEEEKIEAVKAVIRQLIYFVTYRSEKDNSERKREYFKGKVKAYETVLTLLDMDINTIESLIV